MSDELFNFGIGIQVDESGSARETLGAIILSVEALGARISDVNSSIGLDQMAGGIASVSSTLDNTLNSIHDHAVTLETVFNNSAEALRRALDQAGIGSDAIVGAVISETPAEAAEGGPTSVSIAGAAIEASTEASAGGATTEGAFELVDEEAAEAAMGNIIRESGRLGDEASEDFKKITGAAVDLDEELKEEPKNIGFVSKAFKSLSAPAVDAIGSITEVTSSLGKSLLNLGDLVINMATNPAMELERTAVRLTASIGGTIKEADAFVGTVNRLAQQTGFAETEIGALAEQLAFAGFNLGEFSSEDQTALVHLTSNLQVSAQEARAFVVSAELMGASITGLMASAAEFQEQFKIPGLIEQMPAITDNAIKAQSAYGKSVVKDSKKASKGVAKSAAIIAKSLGKTATEAAQDAMETFNAFAGETRSFNDVFLGLSDSFSPMQNAFLETGMSVDRMGSLMKRSQTDQAGFVKAVLRQQSRLDPFMAERFMQQILRNSSAAVQGLLTQAIARKKMTQAELAADDKRRAIAQRRETATKALNNLLGSMRNNVLDTFGEFSAKIDNLFSMVTRLFGPGITAGLNVLLDALGKIIQPFMDIKDSVSGATKESDVFKSAVAGITKVAVGVATVLGSLATTFSALLPALTPVWQAFTGIIGAVAGAGEGVTGLAAAGKVGAKAFTRIIAPIGLVIASIEHVEWAFKKIKKIIESPGKLGFKKFKKIFGTVFVAAIRTIDDFFFGLPSKFIKGLQGGADAVDHEGSKTMGYAFGKILGNVLVEIKDFFKEEIFPYFENINWDDVFGDFDLLGGFTSMFDSVKAFAGGAMDGILEAFDLPPSAASAVWDVLLAETKNQFWKISTIAVSVFTDVTAQLVALGGLAAVKLAVVVGDAFDSLIVAFHDTIKENSGVIKTLLYASQNFVLAWEFDEKLKELEDPKTVKARQEARNYWEKIQSKAIIRKSKTIHESLMGNMKILNDQREEDNKAEIARQYKVIGLLREEFKIETKRIAAVRKAREEENKLRKARGESPLQAGPDEVRRKASSPDELLGNQEVMDRIELMNKRFDATFADARDAKTFAERIKKLSYKDIATRYQELKRATKRLNKSGDYTLARDASHQMAKFKLILDYGRGSADHFVNGLRELEANVVPMPGSGAGN